MNKHSEYELKSDLSEVKNLCDHFRSFCIQHHIDERYLGLLELALVESVNNIIIHAYDKADDQDIQIQYEIVNDSEMVITLKDRGKAFVQNTKNTDQTQIARQELAEGNWGIGLIESIVDEIIRQRDGEINTLIIKKTL